MKTKNIIFFIILAILFSFKSSKIPTNKTVKRIPKNETIHINSLLNKNHQFTILDKTNEFDTFYKKNSDVKNLEIALPFNYKPIMPVFIDNNSFLFLAVPLKNKKVPTKIYIYKYNLHSNNLKLISEKELYINSYTEYLHNLKHAKLLNNGTVLYKLTENILILPINNLHNIKNIHIPSKYQNMPISFSSCGSKIVYSTKKGLFTNSITFENEKKILDSYKSKYSILNPTLSDNNQISFNLFKNKPLGVVIINKNLTDFKFISCENLKTGQWSNDNNIITGTLGYPNIKSIAIIKLKENLIEKYHTQKLNYSGSKSPKNSSYFFQYEYGICIFDYLKKFKLKYRLKMNYDDLPNGSWSPSGKKLLNTSNRKIQIIYISK